MMRAKPKMPIPRLRNMLSRKMAGNSIPVTGINTSGVEVAVGVGLGSAVLQATPVLGPVIVLAVPSAGSIHMIARVFGSGPSMGVSKLMELFAGTTSGPPEAEPPTTHQTMFTS